MRDYQRTKGKYILPRAVYMQTIWVIRDYHRLIDERAGLLAGPSSKPIDGMPHGSSYNPDGVMFEAVRLAEIDDKIKAIESARDTIPEGYRKAVWENILYGTPYPLMGERSTYGHYKSKMIMLTATRLGLYRE